MDGKEHDVVDAGLQLGDAARVYADGRASSHVQRIEMSCGARFHIAFASVRTMPRLVRRIET